MLTIGSLFSGVGGFELGLEMAGLGRTVWQVEKDKYCRAMLAKHWPAAKRYEDIHDVGAHNLEPVDLICGGFPCQPFSLAGKRRGTADDRHLWPEYLRIVTELKPTFVIGENVPGIINMELDQVLSDLEGAGYETATFIIPACAVDAPHRRDRVFVVAYRDDTGFIERWRAESIQPKYNTFKRTGQAISYAELRCGNTGSERAGWEKGSDTGRCSERTTLAYSTESRGRRIPVRSRRQDETAADIDGYGEDVPDTIGEHDDRTGYGAGKIFGQRSAPSKVCGCEDVADTERCGRKQGDENVRRSHEASGEEGKWCGFAYCGDGETTAIWLPEPGVGRVADGVPNRVDRLRCLGNAVVPQVSMAIGTIIREWIDG